MKNEIWSHILKADTIVTGKYLTKLTKSDLKPDSYISFDFSIKEKLIGGDLPSSIPIKIYYRKGENFPLNELTQSEVILFLNDYRHDKYSNCFYFSGNTPKESILKYDEKKMNDIKAEIQHQHEIIVNFVERSEIFPKEDEVKQIIKEFLDASKAIAAYKKLEELGEKAVPAIIKHMNDRRELPVKHIQLENKSKNAWEAFRHYGPQVLIDVLSSILNQITGEYFTDIHNGGTEAQRTKEFHSWVIWYQKQYKK